MKDIFPNKLSKFNETSSINCYDQKENGEHIF